MTLLSQHTLDRRKFLKQVAAVTAAGIATPAALSACSSGTSTTTPSSLSHSSGALNVFSFPPSITPTSAINKVYDSFTRATGIKVNVISEPTDYATFVQKITTALSSGYTGYDVVFADDLVTSSFAAANWLLPLGPYLPKSDINAVSQSHRTLSSYKGQLYRMPLNQQFYVQFYRKDLLQKAGVSVPTTWAELLTAARALTKGGNYGVALAGSPADAFDDFLYFMPQAGGSFLNLESPGTQKALEFLHELVSVYKVVPSSYVTDSYTTIPTYVESGEVAMWASWCGFLGGFVANSKFYRNGRALGIAAPAKGPVSNVTDIGDWGWVIPKSSPRQQAAVKFVAYTSSVASEVEFARTQYIPARMDAVAPARNVITGGGDFVRFLSKVKEVPRPITPHTTQIQNNVTPMLVDYVAGKTSLQTAVKSGQALIRKYS